MLNPSLIRVFDAVLAEAQAPGKAAFMAMAPDLLAGHLSADLRVRALGLLERYVDMREAMQLLPPPELGDAQAVRRAVEARTRLRQRFSTPEEVDGVFRDELRQESFMEEKLAILRSPSLADQQREEALGRAEASWLSPEQLAVRQQATAHFAVQRETDALNARSAGAQERFTRRSARHG